MTDKKTVTLPDDQDMQRLIALLQEHISPLAVDKLTLNTSINHDLGCDGDDAAELMADLADRFPIDFVDYDAYRYFHPEGYDLMRWRRAKDRRGNVPLTLAMMYEAIQLLRWNTTEIEAAA